LLHRRPDRLIALVVKALIVIEIAITGARPQEEFVNVVDVQMRVAHQVVLTKNMRVLLDVVDGEEVEGEIAAVIQQRPLVGRNIRIDMQPRIALNLLKLPLKSLDAGLRRRELAAKGDDNNSDSPKPVS